MGKKRGHTAASPPESVTPIDGAAQSDEDLEPMIGAVKAEVTAPLDEVSRQVDRKQCSVPVR